MTKAWRLDGRRLDGRRVEGLLRGGPSPRRCPSHNLLCFSVSLPPPTPYKSKSVLVMVDGHSAPADPLQELAGYGVEAGAAGGLF